MRSNKTISLYTTLYEGDLECYIFRLCKLSSGFVFQKYIKDTTYIAIAMH